MIGCEPMTGCEMHSSTADPASTPYRLIPSTPPRVTASAFTSHTTDEADELMLGDLLNHANVEPRE
jgi:hypothetical protein